MIALQGACTQTMHPHTDTQCNTPGTHTQYTQTTLLHSTHSDNIPIARSAAHAHRQLVGFQCDVWTTRSRAVWPRRVKPTVQQFLNSRFLTLSETAPFRLSCSLIGQTRPMGVQPFCPRLELPVEETGLCIIFMRKTVQHTCSTWSILQVVLRFFKAGAFPVEFRV